MNWFLLLVAGLLEIGWAIGLKYTESFTKIWPTISTVISLIGSIFLLGISLRTLPVGTAYAVWVGVGAVGTAIFGVILFNEPMGLLKIMSLTFICLGIVGLKLAHSQY